MNTNIEYFNSFSLKNDNIVIFVSKISQLNSIILPFNSKKLIKNKVFNRRIKENKYFSFTHDNSTNHHYFLNIKIFLIDNNIDASEIGASLYDKFNYTYNFNISFVFSNSIKSISSDIIFGFMLKSYNFDKYKKIQKLKPKNIYIFSSNKSKLPLLSYKLNLLKAINITKDLVSEPANILTPLFYADFCSKLKIKNLKVKILNLSQLKKIGMNALLGVSMGSFNEPRVVIFEWNIKKNIKPTVLVGKGVTFDSGGISLKPSGGMEEMITDMGGSAVVVGSLINAALNKSSESLIGIIGLVENMPDGKSQRPGDIVKSLSGKTIEVLNTDAEGRLVLADLLTYVQLKYKPKQIIDFATLTGAIMIALGTHAAGLFSNNIILSKKIIKSGINSGENVWQLPMGDEYDEEINSSRADMKNIGSTRYGGSIHAAQFIQRFVNSEIPWAHLDIAGVSWIMKSSNSSFSKLHAPGATAFGVRLIDDFLKGK